MSKPSEAKDIKTSDGKGGDIKSGEEANPASEYLFYPADRETYKVKYDVPNSQNTLYTLIDEIESNEYTERGIPQDAPLSIEKTVGYASLSNTLNPSIIFDENKEIVEVILSRLPIMYPIDVLNESDYGWWIKTSSGQGKMVEDATKSNDEDYKIYYDSLFDTLSSEHRLLLDKIKSVETITLSPDNVNIKFYQQDYKTIHYGGDAASSYLFIKTGGYNTGPSKIVFTADTKINLADYKLDRSTKIVVFLARRFQHSDGTEYYENDVPHLCPFIGIIAATSEYVAPFLYDTGYGFYINIGPIYGSVDVNNIDGSFMLSFKRSFESGKLVDQYIRTPFIPYSELLEKDEYEVTINISTKETWYVRYYDPFGSGKIISHDQYKRYQNERQLALGDIFPTVLQDLLGYSSYASKYNTAVHKTDTK